MPLTFTTSILLALLASIIFLTLRLLSVLPHNNPRPPPTRRPSSQPHLLLVLGSGGHTTELLLLLASIPLSPHKYPRRTYVVSSGDAFSAARAAAFEATLSPSTGGLSTGGPSAGRGRGGEAEPSYSILTVPRARRVHQHLLTTPLTALRSLAACMRVLRAAPPDVILANGPATAVALVLAALALKALGLARRGSMRCVYVESWARVRRLSLSGRLVLGLVDRFVVQWETLLPATGGRGEYLGVLI